MTIERRNRPLPETLAAQALGWTVGGTGDVVPVIHPSTTYLRHGADASEGSRVYARADNPTYDQAAALLTALEGGEETLLFSSGVAAATAVFQALEPEAHVVVPHVMYWGLRSWLHGQASRWRLRVEGVAMDDPAAMAAAVRPGITRLVWIETPANPLWTITDIRAMADLAHRAGALVVADSTVATPVLTRPLALGADIVMHSATKYLNGHSDVVAGTLTTACRDAFWERIRTILVQQGGILGPFEAWLLLRGMRTLFVRVRQACRTAETVARHFTFHPLVTAVLYPGLPGFPGHEIAARQMTGGFGAMLAIRLRAGAEAALATAAATKLWKEATSLGGVESLIEHRASYEGPSSPVPPDLLRLSVGLEAPEDLIADLEHAILTGQRPERAAVTGGESAHIPSQRTD